MRRLAHTLYMVDVRRPSAAYDAVRMVVQEAKTQLAPFAIVSAASRAAARLVVGLLAGLGIALLAWALLPFRYRIPASTYDVGHSESYVRTGRREATRCL